jgi:hypothetical protein
MLDQLRAELKRVQDDILDADAKNVTLVGGLLKALVECRLEILKTTHELLRQRLIAEESGAPLTVVIPATKPQPEAAASLAREIEIQQGVLQSARVEAARFTGGLVHAMKLSTIATQEQSLAMLHQRFLVAKYGLGCPPFATGPGTPSTSNDGSSEKVTVTRERPSEVPVVKVRLLKKQFTKQNYQDYIFFDIEFSAPGLIRPARAIKGALHLCDLFGESKMVIEWVLDNPPIPGGTIVEKGKGFQYNQFMQPHQWVHSTGLEDMSSTFDVRSIIYQDGSREDLT